MGKLFATAFAVELICLLAIINGTAIKFIVQPAPTCNSTQKIPIEQLYKPASVCYVTQGQLLAKAFAPEFKLGLDLEQCSCQLLAQKDSWVPKKWDRVLETLYNSTANILLGEKSALTANQTEFYQKLNESTPFDKERFSEAVNRVLEFRSRLKKEFLRQYAGSEDRERSTYFALEHLDIFCKKLKADHDNFFMFLGGAEAERAIFPIEFGSFDENIFKLIINLTACNIYLII